MGGAVATIDGTGRETYDDFSHQGYQRLWSGSVGTASGDPEARADFEERLREEFTTPRPDFSGGGLTLRAPKPVSVRIHKGEELWFAENDHLDIHATGRTIQEAVEEFEALLLHFYQHYKELDESKALRTARELKRLFVTGFIESNS